MPRLIANYVISAYAEINLPAGKTVDDVTDWNVKNGFLSVTYADGTKSCQIAYADADLDSIDWRYPSSFIIQDSDGCENIYEEG